MVMMMNIYTKETDRALSVDHLTDTIHLGQCLVSTVQCPGEKNCKYDDDDYHDVECFVNCDDDDDDKKYVGGNDKDKKCIYVGLMMVG